MSRFNSVEDANRALNINPTDHQLAQWCRPKGDTNVTLFAPYVKSEYFTPEDFKGCTTIDQARELVLSRAEEVQSQFDEANEIARPVLNKLEQARSTYHLKDITVPIMCTFTLPWVPAVLVPGESVFGICACILIVSIVWCCSVSSHNSKVKATLSQIESEVNSKLESIYADERFFWVNVWHQNQLVLQKKADAEAAERARRKAEQLTEWRKRQVEQAVVRSVVYTGTKAAMKGITKGVSKALKK